MKGILAIFVINAVIFANCGVLKSPNKDDKEYWHNYNIKFLNKMLNSQKPAKIAKNVILFVGDGMSFATIAAGRILKGQREGKSGEETELVFENFPSVGLSKTYNTDNQVADSASTATAIYSGIKTSFFTIGLSNPAPLARESERLKNIIDWAQEKGKKTGVVTTTK
jgi:alkaline phosphatase